MAHYSIQAGCVQRAAFFPAAGTFFLPAFVRRSLYVPFRSREAFYASFFAQKTITETSRMLKTD